MAHAAPGDLDLTFSGDGKQTTNLGSGLSRAAAVARQPDGKIIAVGFDPLGGFALARYNPDGSLDPSFSGDGKQKTSVGGEEFATGVALQGDGKIVVVGGDGFGPNGNFALARYNPNGSLDTSFSGDGTQTTDFGGFDGATGVAIQGDGKIVAVGAGNSDFAIARYNTNGSLDASFSGDGMQTTDFGGFEGANAVALQANGKIVAAGVGSTGDFALARYNLNGSLDVGFSGDGKQTTDFGNLDEASGVAIQSNGRIVAVGGGNSGDFALARYNPNGSLDTSFSGDGKQITDVGSADEATGVAIQANGRIIAVGGGSSGDFALARYNTNGSLDTSFSGDGKQTTDFGAGDQANGVTLQGDGKIVAVGVAGESGPGGPGGGDFALARYNADGSLDASFSGDGKQRTDFGGLDRGTGVAIQANGRIVVVGTAGTSFGNDFALARYNPNGSLDTSFSGDGRQTTDSGGFSEATGVAIQGDGKIVAVGFGSNGFALARYNPNGSLDTSFSGDGTQTTNFGGLNGATGVAIQGDGKIVAVGVSGDDSDFALARYHPNGSLDTSFSGDGKQTTDFGLSQLGTDGARGVALQADGKIVAVGQGGGFDFALARYNPNGSLDTTFAGDGKETTNFSGDFDGANGVAIQGDGKVVAVGGGFSGSDFLLARYNPNGSLDTSFSGDGRQTTDFFGASDGARDVAIQANGKIVAVGQTAFSDFALARYNPNGSLDPTFSGDGRRRTDFGGSDGATGVALQGNGRIVAAGTGLGPSQTDDFAIARYLGG